MTSHRPLLRLRSRPDSVRAIGPLPEAIAQALRAQSVAGSTRRQSRTAALLSGALLFAGGLALPAQAQNWTGAVSDDWFDGGNWDNGQPPPSAFDAVLNTVTPNPTLIDGGDASVRNLTLGGGPGLEGNLSIINGGTLVASSVGAGGGGSASVPGGTGTITVSGAGSRLSTDNVAGFGIRTGTGRLFVLDGGVVEFGSLGPGAIIFGFNPGSVASATVSGAGSVMSTPGGLTVAEQGNATLTVDDGGAVSAVTAILGEFTGGVGSATVEGSGSFLQVGNRLTVGGGTGTLTIVDGGLADVGDLIVGRDAGSQGTLGIGGTGSRLSIRGSADEFVVGFGGSGTLTVEAGGIVEHGGDSFLGLESGSQGTATVTGAGSQWMQEGALYVGRSGDGFLSIADGGRVEARSALVGDITGGTGTITVAGDGSALEVQSLQVRSGNVTIENGGRIDSMSAATVDAGSAVTVTGSGSVWNVGGVFYVGFASVGSVDVLDGGVVNAADVFIGNSADAEGAVVVSGAGSRWQNSGFITVGDNATGSLTLLDGGVLGTDALVIGALTDGTGAVAVDGNGSNLQATDLTVGQSGTGTLSINAGGAVEIDDFAYVGAVSGSQGTVTVSGIGSELFVEDALFVGQDGNGTLSVQDGGSVAAANLFVGHGQTGIGNATFTGDGSALRLWTLSVGGNGNGSLVIEDGASVETMFGASIGYGTGTGSVTVAGAGSSWNNNDVLTVGNIGTGRLDIIDGGAVSANDGVVIGGAESGIGTLTVDGVGSTLTVNGNLLVSSNGAGSLIVSGGGTVSSQFGSLGFFTSGSDGQALVTGAGSRWDIEDLLTVGIVDGTGTVTVADGGVLSAGGGITLAEQDVGTPSTGTLNIGAGIGDPAVAAGIVDAPSITFGAGNGTINFNHTDTEYVFAAAINGAGTIHHMAGITSLTGAGDAGGALNVDGGTLRVEGALGDMTTTVASGATLGGSGTIAGDVTVLDGATLSPGSSAGTLTLGSLTLSDGSILDYELGQAGVIGSGVNDLIEINGDLTLDGTLDITDIGGFGAGVYRLMNYGGALTDNGLDLGDLPAGSDAQDLFLQTAIDGQVNLVNSAGLTLSFWDGTVASEHNNGAIDDGDGVWDADNDNWTAADGAVNGRWDDGTFAVFGGAGGTVSVVGEQAVAGMQFMAGYTLDAGTDGALRIDGAASVIRVDPTVTATIAAPIVGAGGLVKTDTGTLVLSGANSYTGGTAIDMGTLSVSSDGNLGDAAGALSFDGGTLRNTAAFATSRGVTLEAGGGTFETAAELTVSGTLDGEGALAKTGDGTLVLSGGNTYSGGTTVAAGTLSVSADANLGDAAGALTLAGGTLQTTAAFDSTRDVVLAGGTLQTDADLGLQGTVSGGGALIKDGAGTLTLTGDNTYTGDTRVLDGTLVGDADAIRGDLANDGTVVFDQAVDDSFDGAITGDGDMVKRGAGALTLGAASALDWTIDAGALIARAAQFGGDAAIADGATLRFNEAGGTYAGTLSGTGDFEIAGGGSVFVLTGDSAGFDGGTLLESGTLRIDGALGGLTTIAAGATLTGIGTLGSVDNAGTVAAGNSIGTLTLTGDYVHRDNATLLAEIEPGGTSDLLDVAGTATIEGGTVDIIKLPGQYTGGTRYTLIDAAGGVTGTFDTLDQDLPFLDLLLIYAPNQVFLDVLRNDVDFDIVCGEGSFNQCQVAGALDAIGDGDPIPPDLETVLTEVTTLTLDQARAGFDRLSGEAHASLAGAMLEGHALYGRTVTRRIADRREALGADRLRGGAWVRGYGSTSDLDGDGNAHGADVDVHGLAFGADAWGGESWLIGASVNALRIDADFRAGDAGEADAKNVALYTSVQGERAYLDAVASYAWWDSEVRRRIEVGTIARDTRSEYGAHRFAFALEAGLSYDLGTSTLQPLVSIEHSLLSTQRFREDGADDVDLIGSAQNVERTVAALGLRWTGAFGGGEWTFAPTAQVRWLHTFGDLDAEFDVAFAGAPDVGYRVRGVTVPEDRGLLGVGLLARRDNLDLFVDLDYQAGDGYDAGSLGAGVRWRW